jgi:hypothetical protein
MECCAMKVLKFFLIVSVAITISYFSWEYYTSKSLNEKHERATLVFMVPSNNMRTFWLERLYEYEQAV